MSLRFTIIIGYKDREPERIRYCLESIAGQSCGRYELILVDYGSSQEHRVEARALVERYPKCRYVYAETSGWAWNRSHALNIGLRQACGEYVITTDIDMIFRQDLLEVFDRMAAPAVGLHVFPYFLPPRFDDWKRLWRYRHLPTHQSLGACHCVSTEQLRRLHGYDEYYAFYGPEDRDLNRRQREAGLEIRFLEDQIYMYHQWHPTGERHLQEVLPSRWWDMMSIYYGLGSRRSTFRGRDWGQMVTREDRPALLCRHSTAVSVARVDVQCGGDMYDRAAAVRELARQLGRAASQDVLIVTVAGADSVRQASGELAFSPRQDIRFAVWYLITETQLVADYFMEETIEHAEYVLVRA